MTSVRPTFTQRLLRPRHVWGRLIVLLLPVAVLGVWLKLLRIGNFFPAAGPVEVLAKVASDLAFGAAWMLLWMLACWFAKGTVRTVVFYLAHLATIVVGVFTVINHEYVSRTGNPLTWDEMAYAWRQQGELSSLLQSQMSSSVIALLAFAVLAPIVVPPLLGPLVSRLLRKRPGRKAKAAAVAVLALLLVLSSWSAPTVSAAFSLAAPVQLAVTPVREAMAYPEGLADPTVLPTPDATKLVDRDGKHKNLVVITLESHRATSTLPETRQSVTPVMDALAQSAIRPERGYAVLPHTSKALTAVTCGISPALDSENSEADPGSLPAKCLPELLGEQGYSSAFFQSATENFERRRGTVANFGYQDFTPVDEMSPIGFRRVNYFGYEDDIMLDPARKWLVAHSGQPFMLGMLTVTGHHDYALEGFDLIDFVDDPLLNKYLNGIHYQDQFVGHVLDMFKELGLYDNTVFVITGDHGEGFGEHRVFQHDNTIYDEGLRIPYLIIDPSKEGKLIEGPANQLAVLPTAVDLLGFDLVSDTQYKPSLMSDEPQGPVVATCYARGRCAATMDGDMKVIHHFGDRRDEVYDLSVDPYETNDLAAGTDSGWVSEQSDIALKWYLEAENAYAAYHESK
ncbi:LTA synthase family protein [Tessaracoccus aquimaris]|uniref:LTA synthase family protein n=1 Tax=Tessaracoccus aquimaris TaxID=1332264 RepID=UPI000988EA9D|nr:LTA synthase family protein [Tessaracoccus aquimaris]